MFNPGERVEGFTSPLLALLAALCLALGVDPLAALAGVAAASAAAVLAIAARLERELAAPPDGGRTLPLAPVLLLATPAFAYWSLRALETMLFTALALGAVALLWREVRLRRWRGSGVAFAALAWTRPEGALVFGLAAAALAPVAWRAGPRARAPFAANAALVLGAVGALLAWRRASYDAWLPNTFHAKVTGGAGQVATGLGYALDFALGAPLLAAALLAPLALASRRVRARVRRPALAAALAALVAGQAATVVAVGGDFMPYLRFTVPWLPFAALLSAPALRALARRAGPALVPALVALHGAAGLVGDEAYRAFVAHRTAVVGARVGAWLAERLPPDAWIAVNTAGSLPYASRLPTIDMLGLTDARIARRPVFVISPGWAGHRRGWGEYVLRRRPHAILWYNSAGLAEPHYLSDRELADDARFRFFYALRSAWLPAAAPGQTGAPVRRFAGFPFGREPSGDGAIPDLGLRLAFRTAPLPHTALYEGPVRVVSFELDPRDLGLWDEALALGDDPTGLATAAGRYWAERDRPPGDPAARARVEALCDDARRALERGDVAAARRLLEQAAAHDGAARSPALPQAVANLAVHTGELFAAVAAQKEALRLDPANAVYRANLAHLLGAPHRSFAEQRRRAAAGSLKSGA